MKVNVKVEKKSYHPATGLLLVPGEMEVTAKQAEVLMRAGLATVEAEAVKARTKSALAAAKEE